MIVDSSAIIAMLLDEPERSAFQHQIELAARVGLPSPNFLEAEMVLASKLGKEGADNLVRFLEETDIAILAFTHAHALGAREAFLRFGKGRHPAALNFGDCMAYAVARTEGRPLLFKGADFRLTDIEAAI